VSSDLFALARTHHLDPTGLRDLVAFGSHRGTRTLLVDVLRVTPSWELTPPDVHPDELSRDERAERLWVLLKDAVRRGAAGSSRPRTTLSGGLDSRAIAAAAAAVDSSRFTTGTFGDEDCVDLPVAVELARRLGLRHELSVLTRDAALRSEERVWRATAGYGGPASAPGADTDFDWSEQCDVLLSGTSGDVIWGDTVMPGSAPPRRLARLGVSVAELELGSAAPPAPAWVSRSGAAAWDNLWTRQRGATWDGVRSRLALTPVVPIAWDEALLSFCLCLGAEDRNSRSLLRHMLQLHAPSVSAQALPPVRGKVHDLDRAWRTSAAWGEALSAWTESGQEARWQVLGLHRTVVRRMVKQVRSGRRERASFLSRLRAAWRWAGLFCAQGQVS